MKCLKSTISPWRSFSFQFRTLSLNCTTVQILPYFTTGDFSTNTKGYKKQNSYLPTLLDPKVLHKNDWQP